MPDMPDKLSKCRTSERPVDSCYLQQFLRLELFSMRTLSKRKHRKHTTDDSNAVDRHSKQLRKKYLPLPKKINLIKLSNLRSNFQQKKYEFTENVNTRQSTRPEKQWKIFPKWSETDDYAELCKTVLWANFCIVQSLLLCQKTNRCWTFNRHVANSDKITALCCCDLDWILELNTIWI